MDPLASVCTATTVLRPGASEWADRMRPGWRGEASVLDDLVSAVGR